MGITPADLAWINRLPKAPDMAYEDINRLRAMQAHAVRQQADRSEIHLLDSLLTHADEITARHHEPQRRATRLRQVEDEIELLRRSGMRQVTVAAERLAAKKVALATRETLEEMRNEPMSSAERTERRYALERELKDRQEQEARDIERETEKALNVRVRALHDERKELVRG